MPIFSPERKQFKRIAIEKIARNPNQPRRVFAREGLVELADSIVRYGVINPLTVRPVGGGYELIAGERRLRAAQMAGLTEVPCCVLPADPEQSSLIALVENLQRRDLDFFEEAMGLQRLTTVYGMTQSQAAERTGRSQSAVANKLRLLRLPTAIVDIIREARLSERHARVLLRLPDADLQLRAVREMAAKEMTVERAEALVDRLLCPPQPQIKRRVIVKDVRILLNTIGKAVDTVKAAGLPATFDRSQDGEDIVLTIRIPSVSTAAARS